MLIERESELRTLRAALDASRQGQGRVVLLAGEAGIGKTAVLRAFTREVDDAVRVLWGACDPLETPRPFGPLHDVARAGVPRLLAALGSAGGRDAVFEATLAEITTHRRPTILIIEDAHWADEATLDLLRFVGRRLQRVAALLVVSFRDDEIGPLHRLRRAIGELPADALTRIHLRPLSVDAVQRLATEAGRTGQTLHAITGGNPFFVTEALAAAGADGGVPENVRDAVLARAARLSPAARALMQLAAVMPGQADGWLLQRILAPTDAALEECASIGMVRVDQGGLRFRHELARRAVEESLPLDQRRAWHEQCLRHLLDATPAAPDYARLVHHAEGAHDADRVRDLAVRAAAHARAHGAHREAARHYAAAVRVGIPVPHDRAIVLEQLAYECYLTDQIAEARAARRKALDIWSALGERERVGDTQRWLSRLAWFAGDGVAAHRLADEAIATLRALPAGAALAMAYSNRAQLYMLADRTDDAVLWGEQAIALAESLGDVEILSHALNNVGTVQVFDGRPEGRERLVRSLTLALEHGLGEHAARAYTNLGSSALEIRQCDDARHWLDEGIRYTIEHDLDSWTMYMRACRARLHFIAGRWNDAMDDALAVTTNPFSATVSRLPAMAVLARVRRHRNDPGWEALLDEARTLAWETTELQRVEPVACAIAEAAWLSGDMTSAQPALEAAWSLAEPCPVDWRRGELALWRARADAQWSAAQTDRERLPVPVRHTLDGDHAAAAAHWRNLGCVLDEAMALMDAEEEPALRDALARFEQLGSVAGVVVARRRLVALGARGVPRGARPATRAHPAGLTLRQQEILALLGEGQRNAEIARRLGVSEKTVDHHVSAVLEKLGARSRTEAVAKARELGVG